MRLDEFVWSRNPRGLHVYSIYQSPLDIARYTRMRAGWAKLIAAGLEYVDDAQRLLDLNITPCVRLYLGAAGATPFAGHWRSLVDAFARVGVRWFEFYNEPNLGVEWPAGIDPDWRDEAGIIKPLMDNWLLFAEYVVSIGCYPGFIPLAESDDLRRAAVPWMDTMLRYLADHHFERYQRVLASGLYCATHPYILNHWYQETPGGGPTSARSRGQVNAREPGWHFEYPYDPLQQSRDPGRTVYGGTALTPNGDPVGLTAMGRMFNERCAAWFGSQAVPVLGTEGGIFPIRDQVYQQDTRYPAYDEFSQAEGTVAMFEWIARQAPPWLFGVTLWKEDDYYLSSGGAVRAIDRLAETSVVVKEVPAVEVMGSGLTGVPTLPAVGPGPIHGAADFHMVLLAPGLDSSWFFDSARAYWDLFHPMVTTLTELIDFIPGSQSLAVTVIAAPDLVETMQRAIRDRFRYVYFDLVVADNPVRVKEVFDGRVQLGLRFG
ncbi:MAG: hypothetical protein L6Q98_23140 [Anaerolineae bacterium]|nr:hypothetical protein [Anaerolineae bacterium]NUQ05371.1 hypothetical protein [Anaerolineae bacterium]